MAAMSDSRLLRAIPVLPSMDLARTRDFYTSKLGFTVLFEVPGRTGLGRDGVEIQFWPIDDPADAPNAGCRIEVEGIAALYAAVQPSGAVHPNAPLTAQPWGFHEFGLIDPDSNLLMFAERIAGWRAPS